ncbi:hypothetical protein [Marinoscillum sp.]|uniref:hypothetical protein n=1 Tax=Marinoscillum sp. TaxID=2024838 RepID=UPI003BAD0275
MKASILYSLTLIALVACDHVSLEEQELILPEYYVYLTIDDEEYLFHEDMGVFNSYITGPNQDQLSIVLGGNLFYCELHILDSRLDQQTFPLTMSSTQSDGYAELQLVDRNESVEMMFGPEDNVNFIGVTFEDLEVTVLEYEDQVISGEVKGTIRTRTGRVKEIDDGKFNVAISLVASED